MKDKIETLQKDNLDEKIETTKDKNEKKYTENTKEPIKINNCEENERKYSTNTENSEDLVLKSHTKFKLENLLKDFFEKQKMAEMEKKFPKDIEELEKDKYSFIFDVVKRKKFVLTIIIIIFD